MTVRNRSNVANLCAFEQQCIVTTRFGHPKITCNELGYRVRAMGQASSYVTNFTQVARTALSKAGIDRTYSKVFSIGFNKTATTSIHALFGELGFKARYHDTAWRSKSAHWQHWRGQAFSDGPPQDFRKLDRRYPRSKFILNTRDPLEWLDSRCEHIKLLMKTGLHTDKGTWRFSQSAVEAWVHQRNNYHTEVINYFRSRPRDLLVVNFIRDPDAADKIASFLDASGNWEKPFARSTEVTRKPGQLKNAGMIEGALRNLGVNDSEWSYDIHFPSLGSSSAIPHDTSVFQPQTF